MFKTNLSCEDFDLLLAAARRIFCVFVNTFCTDMCVCQHILYRYIIMFVQICSYFCTDMCVCQHIVYRYIITFVQICVFVNTFCK